MAIIIIIMGLATAWAIGYMYVMFLRILFVKPSSRPDVYNLVPRRQHKYRAEDFYDEPDGFYVTMPDGSVRIDD